MRRVERALGMVAASDYDALKRHLEATETLLIRAGTAMAQCGAGDEHGTIRGEIRKHLEKGRPPQCHSQSST